MKKGIFGLILMLVAAVLALYVGGWQLALGATADLINFVVKGQVVTQMMLIWPLVKFAAAGAVGMISMLIAGGGGWLVFTAFQDFLED